MIKERFKVREQKDDCDCWEGGAIQRSGKPVTKSCLASKQQSKTHDLQFVYDFCNRDTIFDKLYFVNNAGRAPLDDFLNDETFENMYGLPRRLKFKKAEPRTHVPSDWWSSVYE